ncbi:Cationic amino acid transporter 7, chloroplastic [Sesamum angolense]|uniref:Cationic amino acid transporter 7, chloroplastic n=1 Tax=Sesamum angolense TaxID=2727404 RepID=A0AAE1W010_9LAMI|nr:Cationic amino acid transporter 7, chloroplastic [Sesamum angolense]
MVGAGVFVTTGHASRLCAGPAVVLSYAIAGLCALLSAFCYTEFAVDMPVAGGAFSYIRVTFGEFLAFLTGSNLIIDYVLSNAAVARGFTDYLGTALGLSNHTQLRFTIHGLPKGYNEIDLIAVAVVLLLTLYKESSWLNMVLTVLHILFIVFVIVVGFWRGDWNNFTEPGNPKNAGGFFPFGASGVFNGAAMVYLSYIGYDAVSTMAEEVKDPVKNIPIGVSGSVILVTVLYCLMAASMSALLPYDMIDPEAPFSGAFREGSSGWRWVSNVIGVGASFGILTSLLVAMLGQARYMCVIGRSCVVPSWFARVHHSTSTPVNASAFLGIFTAAIALFTDLNILLKFVSIGTLFIFYMVANAVIYRRYVTVGTTNPWPTLSFLFCFSLTSVIFTLLWQFAPSGKPKGFMLGSCIAVAIGIVQPSYVRFGFFSALVVLVYVLYSVHSSFDAEEDGTLSQKTGESMKESIEREDYTLKV